MAGLDWTKVKQALETHDLAALLVLAWTLSIPLYLILQIWFGYAWVGRWRIAALVPLISLVCLPVLFFVGQSFDPDVFGPPSQSLFDNPMVAVMLFSPVGFIYLVIAGIMHRTRSAPASG